MTQRARMVALAVVVLALASACSGPAPAKPGPNGIEGAPLASGAAGDLKVALYSAPAQPARGQAWLEAAITDAAGRPVADATVTFDLNMTTMNHGKNVVTGSATEAGRYLGEVSFVMPGPWRVIVDIDQGGRQNSVWFDVMVR